MIARNTTDIEQRLRTLALIAGLLPFLAIHTAYLISAKQGFVPWCLPYVDSCTSVSATGRHGLAYIWFKLTMIPAAGVLALFWLQFYQWQNARGYKPSMSIFWVGLIGAICLAIYTLALGANDELYRTPRRIGATVYFTFTYLSELMLAAWFLRQNLYPRYSLALMGLCAMCLLIGMTSLLIDAFTTWHDDVEDAFEWILALLIDVYFLVVWFIMRRSPRSSRND